MNQYQELSKSLYNLFLIAEEKIIIAKSNNLLKVTSYEKLNAHDLDFKFGDTHFSYDWDNIESFDTYDWSTDNFIDFIDKDIKPLPEFECVTKELCKAFHILEDKETYVKNIGVVGYIKLLMNKIPNGAINKQNITEYIQIFINDYKTYSTNNLFTWNIQLWLGSFHFENDLIKIDTLKIRKPVKEELYHIRPKTNIIDEFERITGKALDSASILEFSMQSPTHTTGFYSNEIKHEIENCLDVLRLFKVGNITITHLSVHPISVLEHGHSEWPSSPFAKVLGNHIDNQSTSRYAYMVKKEEESLLINFFKTIKPIIKDISPKNHLSGDYIEIAFHRYKDSLIRSDITIDRMTFAITCLEALLSNSRYGVVNNISTRVAQILSHYGFIESKVIEKLKTAYKVRSLTLHGSELNKAFQDFTKNHTHEIVNYARICLLVMIQLKNCFGKDEFIDKIKSSLIDSKTNAALGSLLKENVLLPIVYPFINKPGGDEIINEAIK